THTHGGPETGVITSIAAPDPAYLVGLERTLVEVVGEAAGRIAPARIGWARGECHAAHNRVLARAGEDDTRIDPDLVVARVESAGGAPLATLIHYTCH